jgi:protein phosphatase
MRIAAVGVTSVGRVRDLNEDSFLVDERLRLYAVADGMGGHQGGEVASRTAIEALRAAVASGRAINDAIASANAAVLEKATGEPDLEGMGTTLTAVVATVGDTLLIGHVGDSRAYLLRDDALERLTEDHSLVEELVREGRLTPEQAEVHPQRAIITRALGVDPDIDVDLYTARVRAGDRVLLCSDGLTTMVRERDIARLARSERDARVVADTLVEAANEAGGDDNITVVVLDVVEVDPVAVEPPDADTFLAPAPSVTPEPVPAPDLLGPPRARRTVGVGRRRRILSAALVVLPLLAVLAVAVGGVAWYARQSYYVGFDGDEVVLYRGIPGGVLGFDPTVEQRSGIERAALEPADAANVDDGAARGSRTRAERFLSALEDRTTTTSTTRPRTTTTTRAPSTTTRAGAPTTAP